MLIFGSHLSNRCVLFLTDNQAVVHIINKQTSRDKKIMILVRLLVTTCLKYNIHFKSKHVSGKLNIEADALSRLQILKFQTLCPGANRMPTDVPRELQLDRLLEI